MNGKSNIPTKEPDSEQMIDKYCQMLSADSGPSTCLSLFCHFIPFPFLALTQQ